MTVYGNTKLYILSHCQYHKKANHTERKAMNKKKRLPIQVLVVASGFHYESFSLILLHNFREGLTL